MVSVKFYWSSPGWSVAIYQQVEDGGQLCIWDATYVTYGEAMLKSANALKRYFPDVLRLDPAPKTSPLEPRRPQR